MIEAVSGEIAALWPLLRWQLREIVPYLALGIVLGSAIAVFGKSKIHMLFGAMRGRRLGILGIALASLLGIASPLCMYGTIPIAASFAAKGVKDDWLAAFMMSSVLLNPQLIIYSMALGPAVLVVRLLSCFLCGVFAGLCVRYFFRGASFFNFEGFGAPANRDTDPNPWLRLLKNMWRNVKATGPWFLVGIILAVLFLRYIPMRAFAGFFGGGNIAGVLMAALLGVPLYVCGGGTIPLLAGWLQAGMSLGAAAAFMITGPATKITNLGAVKIVLGYKHFVFYLAYVFVFALVTGVVVNLIL